jgi:hypothetical protein
MWQQAVAESRQRFIARRAYQMEAIMRELTDMELNAVSGGYWRKKPSIKIDVDVDQENTIRGDNYGGVNQQANVANVFSFNSFGD